jgi:hypothetical protein
MPSFPMGFDTMIERWEKTCNNDAKGVPGATSAVCLENAGSRNVAKNAVATNYPQFRPQKRSRCRTLDALQRSDIETRKPVRWSVEEGTSSTGTRCSMPPLELPRQRDNDTSNRMHRLCRHGKPTRPKHPVSRA